MPARPLHEVVAENVRALRKGFGWTQTDLADRMGVQHPVIARIEAGRRGLNSTTIDALAEALGTSVAALVTPVEKSSPVA